MNFVATCLMFEAGSGLWVYRNYSQRSVSITTVWSTAKRPTMQVPFPLKVAITSPQAETTCWLNCNFGLRTLSLDSWSNTHHISHKAMSIVVYALGKFFTCYLPVSPPALSTLMAQPHCLPPHKELHLGLQTIWNWLKQRLLSFGPLGKIFSLFLSLN